MEDVAHLAAVTRRSATRILRRGHLNGQSLEIRAVYGRGGKSGLSYQVSLSSLSEALERPLIDAWETLPLAVASDRRAASDQGATIGKRFDVIRDALECPEGSKARVAAVATAAARHGTSVRTVERWIANYLAHGLTGLARQKPANAGKRRVVVSKVFDHAFRAAGGTEDQLAAQSDAITEDLRGLWASRAEQSGWADIGRMAEFLLLERCASLGLAISKAAGKIGRARVESQSAERAANIMRNDRKRFSDTKPFIARDWTGFEPMQMVVGDVKPLDVVITRPDGSLVYPKMVAFMDAGTGRVFHRLYMLAKGEGIRQEHITETFIDMCSDPAWGFPKSLYLDNGSEFAGLEKIRGALELINLRGVRPIIYAKAYHASSKPVEALFARLDRYVFAAMPGHVGGNRMAKKIQTVGRPPKPFPGPWEEFEATVSDLIKVYHDRPQGGQWGGRSPFKLLSEWIDKGWRPVTVNPLEIDAAFCNRDSRRVDRGVIKIGGERLTHPTLYALPARTVVQIALPWRRGGRPLFQAPGLDWAYLDIDFALPADWKDGAKEAGRRQRAQVRHITKAAKAAPVIDPMTLKRRMAGAVEVPAVPQTHAGDRLHVASQLADLATARASAEADMLDSITEAERQARATNNRTARLLRNERDVA